MSRRKNFYIFELPKLISFSLNEMRGNKSRVINVHKVLDVGSDANCEAKVSRGFFCVRFSALEFWNFFRLLAFSKDVFLGDNLTQGLNTLSDSREISRRCLKNSFTFRLSFPDQFDEGFANVPVLGGFFDKL